MEEVKRCLSFTFQWPPSLEPSIGHQALDPSIGHQALDPSIGHQALDPSIGHQALDPSIGHQALDPSIGHQALDPPSPPFSFFLKGELRIMGSSLLASRTIFMQS